MSSTNCSTVIKISQLLEKLEDSFYNIDSGLIQHPDLFAFFSQMENIIIQIKQLIQQDEKANADIL